MRLWAVLLVALVCLVVAAGAQEVGYAFAGQRITWADTARTPITSTAFRGTFELTKVPTEAWLVLEVDDQFNAYVNGRLAGSIPTFTEGKARAYPVSDLLRQGRNAVAVEAYSALDKMSLGLDVRADSLDGTVLISSSDAFRARLCPAPPEMAWAHPDFDDSAWAKATTIAPPGTLPLLACERPKEAFRFPSEAYLPSLIPPDYGFSGQWIQPARTPAQGEQGAVLTQFTVRKGQFDHVVAFVTGDDRYMLYVNGTQLGWDWSPVSWNCGEVFDISDVLVDGPNFIVIRLRNDLPPHCAALAEVWGLNGGDSFIDAPQRTLLTGTSPEWDSVWGNIYEDRDPVQKAVALGKPPCEPWFTLKAIPCRQMPTSEQ